MQSKTYYYFDEINDDFASTNINQIKLDENYKYISKNPIFLFFEVILRFIAYIIVFLILKIGFLETYKNKKVLRKEKGGYFIYGNHTNLLVDAYNPSVMCFPKKAHIIANADVASIKGLQTILKMFGIIPIPTTISGMRNYKNAIYTLALNKRAIAIFPEAHIWPYYTKIRNFGTQSFHYPVETNLPSYTFTTVYKKRKFKLIKRPKVVTYINGPFYPDNSLNKKDRIFDLRNRIYNQMKEDSKNNSYEYVKYVKVDSPLKSNAKNYKKNM